MCFKKIIRRLFPSKLYRCYYYFYRDSSTKLTMAVLICLFATAQSGFLALIFATSPDKWKLQMGCKAFNRPIQCEFSL